MFKRLMDALRACRKIFLIIFGCNDDDRESYVETLNELDRCDRIRRVIDKCKTPELMERHMELMALYDKYVVVAHNDGDEKWHYESNDDAYDIWFRNGCKDVIRNELFDKIGALEYEKNLQTFEPDLFNAFNEINYGIARAEYAEAELNYVKALNDPQGYIYKSQYFYNMWNMCQDKKRIMEEMARALQQNSQN